jgi:hypothetical protein
MVGCRRDFGCAKEDYSTQKIRETQKRIGKILHSKRKADSVLCFTRLMIYLCVVRVFCGYTFCLYGETSPN